jgi:hypothetical protein
MALTSVRAERIVTFGRKPSVRRLRMTSVDPPDPFSEPNQGPNGRSLPPSAGTGGDSGQAFRSGGAVESVRVPDGRGGRVQLVRTFQSRQAQVSGT